MPSRFHLTRLTRPAGWSNATLHDVTTAMVLKPERHDRDLKGSYAILGGIAGSGRGAAIGALAGGALGAAGGAVTTPSAPRP